MHVNIAVFYLASHDVWPPVEAHGVACVAADSRDLIIHVHMIDSRHNHDEENIRVPQAHYSLGGNIDKQNDEAALSVALHGHNERRIGGPSLAVLVDTHGCRIHS